MGRRHYLLSLLRLCGLRKAPAEGGGLLTGGVDLSVGHTPALRPVAGDTPHAARTCIHQPLHMSLPAAALRPGTWGLLEVAGAPLTLVGV